MSRTVSNFFISIYVYYIFYINCKLCDSLGYEYYIEFKKGMLDLLRKMMGAKDLTNYMDFLLQKELQ